jgi:hypothetical protein
MKDAKNNLMKFSIVKEIMDTLYESGAYVDKEMVLELLDKDIDYLRKLLREVKISGVLNENKKRD